MYVLFNFQRSNGDVLRAKGSCRSDLVVLYLGEELPGSSMSPAEKQRLFEQLQLAQAKALQELESAAWHFLGGIDAGN